MNKFLKRVLTHNAEKQFINAVIRNHTNVVKYMLKNNFANAYVKERDTQEPAIHLAVSHKKYQVLKLIVDYSHGNINVILRKDIGEHAGHRACHLQDSEAIKILGNAGCDFSIRNNLNYDCYDICIDNEREDLACLIESFIQKKVKCE